VVTEDDHMAYDETTSNKTAESSGEPADETFALPIIHGSGITIHHDELSVYDALRERWWDLIGEAGETHEITSYTPQFADEPYHFQFCSKRWKAGTGEGDDYTPFHEYLIFARRETPNGLNQPPQRLKLQIQPQRHEMNHPDGNPIELPHGEGTRIEIETTYAQRPGEVIRRAQRLLSEIIPDYEPAGLDWDTGRIKKLESHLRYERSFMETVVNCLIHTERLISWMGRSDLSGDHERRRPGWDIWRFSSTVWHKLGFPKLGDYTIGLKTYSAPNWEDYPKNHHAHHPKIEAFYAGRKWDETAPHLDDWDDLVDLLRHIVVMHAHNWTGIERDDLVADPFFAGPDAHPYEYESLDGRREDLRAMQEDTKTEIVRQVTESRSDVPYTLISLLLANPLGVSFKTLKEELGVSHRTVRTHAARLEEAGIADRVGNPGELRFRSTAILEVAREAFNELDPDATASDLRERRENHEKSGQHRHWGYLPESGLTRQQFIQAVQHGNLSDDEIRVALDAVPTNSAEADDD
jgi:DNA-binding transcriptional ArsR family regulator